MRAKILLFILFLIITSALFGESSEKMLDQAIEEFSKGNYAVSLSIIDDVLVQDPSNKTAIMYRQTIEDVASKDQEDNISNKPVVLDHTVLASPNVDRAVVTKTSLKSNNNIFSMKSTIAGSPDEKLILGGEVAISIDSFFLEFIIKSNMIDYDIMAINPGTFPLNDAVNIDNYYMDYGIGFHNKLFLDDLGKDGYFNLKLGVTNFSIDNMITPYIGFDSEFSMISRLWLGFRGSMYSFNGEYVNNYSGEIKAGFKFDIFSIGAFYNISNLDTLASDSYNRVTYGLVTGFYF
ncbi:MAG: hypothetical protein B6229_01710 [Spirochaetaceae bacterium 4572_7]|nr:MAG: hypothetical protein B6229_01710 [Spirochaetaceae bacterium 4572_7]